ncbi:MAG: hypothetical protein DRO00_01185 [Thermoproteota archaeon]|nr:MAG: hypothetical protein DRO00_01185 [Candidatus Korarchaeota archaeon]
MEQKQKQVKLIQKIEVLEPFIEGVHHWEIAICLGEDGQYYITSQHGTPSHNGPVKSEFIFWDPKRIIAGPFPTPIHAREYWEEEA